MSRRTLNGNLLRSRVNRHLAWYHASCRSGCRMPQWPWFCDWRGYTIQIRGGSAQINDAINRLVVKCNMWMVLWRGIERLGPSSCGDRRLWLGGLGRNAAPVTRISPCAIHFGSGYP